jgi:hypothetical protein
MQVNASWMVRYKDGRELRQFDSDASEFFNGEVPYRKINWPEVKELVFGSELIEQTFDITDPPEGYTLSLRSRHFRVLSGDTVTCFMLTLSKTGEEVTNESVASVLYWFPNGSTHECPHFNCPDVGAYGAAMVHELTAKLMPATHELRTEVSASTA